jgi:hypothetical protein
MSWFLGLDFVLNIARTCSTGISRLRFKYYAYKDRIMYTWEQMVLESRVLGTCSIQMEEAYLVLAQFQP